MATSYLSWQPFGMLVLVNVKDLRTNLGFGNLTKMCKMDESSFLHEKSFPHVATSGIAPIENISDFQTFTCEKAKTEISFQIFNLFQTT